jgi:hypothetical protein
MSNQTLKSGSRYVDSQKDQWCVISGFGRSVVKKLLLVFAVLAIPLVGTAAAQAAAGGGSLDQFQYDIQGSAVIVSGGPVVGQTFTPARSGYLTDVVLMLDLPVPATLPLRVSVHPVDGSGAPDTSAGLAAQDLSASDVPSGSPGVVDIAFSSPALLTAGTQYAFVLSTNDTFGYEIQGTGNSSYTGGNVFFAPGLSGPWVDVGAGTAAWFETYMLTAGGSTYVPPPSQILVCGNGVGGVAYGTRQIRPSQWGDQSSAYPRAQYNPALALERSDGTVILTCDYPLPAGYTPVLDATSVRQKIVDNTGGQSGGDGQIYPEYAIQSMPAR